MNTYQEFIKQQTGVEVTCNSKEAYVALCTYILRAMSLETPRIASSYAESLGIQL